MYAKGKGYIKTDLENKKLPLKNLFDMFAGT
jgi:hypothetical protein